MGCIEVTTTTPPHSRAVCEIPHWYKGPPDQQMANTIVPSIAYGKPCVRGDRSTLCRVDTEYPL